MLRSEVQLLRLQSLLMMKEAISWKVAIEVAQIFGGSIAQSNLTRQTDSSSGLLSWKMHIKQAVGGTT